jgi:hypothetical protein
MGGHNPVQQVAALRWIRRPDSRGTDGQNQWNKQLPQSDIECRKRCNELPNALSNAYGKPIKVYVCEPRKVAGLTAFYTEFDGVVDATRSMQYEIQKSSSVEIVLTATCKNNRLETIRKEFEDIMDSFRKK